MKTHVNPFEKYKKEYWSIETTKHRKSEILDTVMDLTGMNRKSIIRKFKVLRLSKERSVGVKIGRPKVYDHYDDYALYYLWEVSGKVCGELLHPMIPEYIAQCKKYGKWDFSCTIEKKVQMMSERTVKRKVSVFFKKDRDTFRKGVSTTQSSSIKTVIPIKTDSWFVSQVGDGQLDTVVHCGDTLSGEMAYTLNFTDFKTYWIGLRAQMGKGERATVDSLMYIKNQQLPFPLLSIQIP